MDRCAKCDAALGPDRFCMNCGHRVGDPVAPGDRILAVPPTPPAQQTPPRRWALIGGISVLVLVLVVITSCLAGGDDTRAEDPGPAATSEPSPTPDETATAPPQTHTNVTSSAQAWASATATATRELDGSTVSFDAAHLVDGKRATAWRVPGDGREVELSFTFSSPHTLSKVGLVNGWDKVVRDVDWYPLNRRITKAVWLFDDGSRVVQKFTQRRTLQRLRIDPVTTTTVRLRIRTTTAPGEGLMGRDYTAISDVAFAGAPA